MKDGPKNRLRALDVHKIVDIFNRRLEVPKYSRMVPVEEIERNEFNLNLPRFIDSQEAEDLQDIEGHLRGGIPGRDVDALCQYWKVCPNLRQVLFKPNRPGYVDLARDKAAIKATIYGHAEYATFITRMNGHFATWRQKTELTLRQLNAGGHPKQIIAALSEDLLAHYSSQPLIDKYDVYQHLMDYWAETMQDDCYLIAADGWKAETYRIIEKDKKGKEKDKGWACDLIPKALVVARYFAAEQQAITSLEGAIEAAAAKMTELEEEHGGDEGFFSELEKVNKANVIARLEEIEGDNEAKDEVAVLDEWLKLANEEGALRKRVKDAEADLDAKANRKYPMLTEPEIKTMVVNDKWLAALDAAVHGEMDRISHALTQRVKELAERYETPLPRMVSRVADLEDRVNSHLQRMGFSWE